MVAGIGVLSGTGPASRAGIGATAAMWVERASCSGTSGRFGSRSTDDGQEHRGRGTALLVARSDTVMPCRWASRLTTNRPIRRARVGRDVATGAQGLVEVRQGARPGCRGRRPRPRSVTPSGAVVEPSETVVVGGEYASALSTSSVSRWTTSAAAASLMRAVLADADPDALVVLHARGRRLQRVGHREVVVDRGRGWVRRRGPAGCPPYDACAPPGGRAGRGSRAGAGSSSSFSSVSMRPSCWLIREVLRRERVTNISLTWDAELGLARGQRHRLPVQVVDGPGQLADLLVGGDVDRHDPAGVLTRSDLGDRLGELLVGDGPGALAHPADGLEEQPGDRGGPTGSRPAGRPA